MQITLWLHLDREEAVRRFSPHRSHLTSLPRLRGLAKAAIVWPAICHTCHRGVSSWFTSPSCAAAFAESAYGYTPRYAGSHNSERLS
jgi:hypothetical protein